MSRRFTLVTVALTAIVAFLIVHVALALLVPKSLRAMVTGS